MVEVQIGISVDKCTNVGELISRYLRKEIEEVLKSNANLCGWSASDIPRIDPYFICHKLSTLPQSKQISQRKRKLEDEKRSVADYKVNQFLIVDIIREVSYITWLTNVVMVKKASEKCRMCVDYSNLNKACPKDTYSLSCINRLIDNTTRYELLIFLDTYSGYN